jgi:hypothetical protein
MKIKNKMIEIEVVRNYISKYAVETGAYSHHLDADILDMLLMDYQYFDRGLFKTESCSESTEKPQTVNIEYKGGLKFLGWLESMRNEKEGTK